MSNNEFISVCKDYQPTNGPIRKGCGQQIVMKKYPDGKWHPHNEDGTPHKHAESKPTPPATPTNSKPSFTTNGNGNNGQRAYYEGILEVQKAVNTSEVNSMLKEGWVILKLDSETTYVREAENERVDHAEGVTYRLMQTSSIMFVMGKRAQ